MHTRATTGTLTLLIVSLPRPQRALCVVAPNEDLYDAIRRMVLLDAHVMLVVTSVSGATLSATDLVGVVTRGDIAKNVAAKSQLLSRDRTLAAD